MTFFRLDISRKRLIKRLCGSYRTNRSPVILEQIIAYVNIYPSKHIQELVTYRNNAKLIKETLSAENMRKWIEQDSQFIPTILKINIPLITKHLIPSLFAWVRKDFHSYIEIILGSGNTHAITNICPLLSEWVNLDPSQRVLKIVRTKHSQAIATIAPKIIELASHSEELRNLVLPELYTLPELKYLYDTISGNAHKMSVTFLTT